MLAHVCIVCASCVCVMFVCHHPLLCAFECFSCLCSCVSMNQSSFCSCFQECELQLSPNIGHSLCPMSGWLGNESVLPGLGPEPYPSSFLDPGKFFG